MQFTENIEFCEKFSFLNCQVYSRIRITEPYNIEFTENVLLYGYFYKIEYFCKLMGTTLKLPIPYLWSSFSRIHNFLNYNVYIRRRTEKQFFNSSTLILSKYFLYYSIYKNTSWYVTLHTFDMQRSCSTFLHYHIFLLVYKWFVLCLTTQRKGEKKEICTLYIRWIFDSYRHIFVTIRS